MKKILNIIMAAGIFFTVTSCMGDKGTSTEVTYANEDEEVNPRHIRGYYGLDSLAELVAYARPGLPQDGQLATEVVKAYYIGTQDISGVIRQFNLSETVLVAGQTADANVIAPTSATNPMEQQSMRTVQDSVNVVTGAINKEDARPEQGKKAGTSTTGNNTKEQ